MASDLITYLVDEKVAEIEKKYADELQQTRTAMSRALYQALQEAVEDAVILRFPNTPAVLVRNIRSLSDPEQLASLRRAVLQAPDQPAVEALLAAVRTEG
jgi:hypothetical protein